MEPPALAHIFSQSCRFHIQTTLPCPQPQEGFSDLTCYIRYRGLICEVRLVIRSMQIHRNQMREHLKVTRCRSADEFVADIVDDWTAKEIWDEVPPPHLQPCVKNYKYCKCCKCVRNDVLQLLMCALWWGVLVGALISGALLFPPSEREVLQWCEKPEGEHYTEFMGCHSWLPFFCTPGVLANNTDWAASYSDIYYSQPEVCTTLCLSPYAGEYYQDTHTWICNTPSVEKTVSYNTTDPAAEAAVTAKVCRANAKYLGDTHCDEADKCVLASCSFMNSQTTILLD